MAAQYWLSCKVSPGQFSEEYAVTAQDHENAEFSLFVNSEFIDQEFPELGGNAEYNGRVLVTVLDEKQGLALVRLPGKTFANGSTVTVRLMQLKAVEPNHA